MAKAKAKDAPAGAKWGLPEILVDTLSGWMSDSIAYVLIAVSCLIYVAWAGLSHATWDGDCPTRYFNALNAFRNPEHFVMVWNRPLWIWIFAVPVHVSKFAIPVIMSAIAGVAALALYRASRIDKIQFAWIVVVFLLFQPFFFGTGRDAMTEPLAAAIMAISYYAMKRERWMLFAIMGALLPLARAELVIHLVFWIFPLLRHGKWKLLPILGGGVAIWWVAAGVITGDWFYLYNQTFGSGIEGNRYGSQEVNTYLSRLFYVMGPVVFFFMVLGLFRAVIRRDWTFFIEIQLIFGIILYTLFAWKIDMGQSAGFLRNLVSLSSLIALVAIRGFDFWIKICFVKNKLWLILSAAITGALVTIFYRDTLEIHHLVTDNPGYFHLTIIGILVLLSFVPWNMLSAASLTRRLRLALILTCFICVAAMGFTLVTEPPDAGMSEERRMLDDVVTVYKNTFISEAPKVYCSHNWFYWSANINNRAPGFSPVLLDSVKLAPDGAVVIWEGHFADRILGDVPIEYFENPDAGYTRLATIFSDDYRYSVTLFIKRDKSATELEYISRFAEATSSVPYGYVNLARYHALRSSFEQAFTALDKAEEISSGNAIVDLERAVVLTMWGDPEAALELFDNTKEDLEHYVTWHAEKGYTLYTLERYAEAVNAFELGLNFDPNNAKLHFNMAVCLLSLNDREGACNNFRRAADLGFAQAREMLTAYCN